MSKPKQYIIKTVPSTEAFTYEDYSRLEEVFKDPVVRKYVWELAYNNWEVFQASQPTDGNEAMHQCGFAKGVSDIVGKILDTPKLARDNMVKMNEDAGLKRGEEPKNPLQEYE